MKVYVIDTQSSEKYYLVYLGEESDEPFCTINKRNPLENVVELYENKGAIVKVI